MIDSTMSLSLSVHDAAATKTMTSEAYTPQLALKPVVPMSLRDLLLTLKPYPQGACPVTTVPDT